MVEPSLSVGARQLPSLPSFQVSVWVGRRSSGPRWGPWGHWVWEPHICPEYSWAPPILHWPTANLSVDSVHSLSPVLAIDVSVWGGGRMGPWGLCSFPWGWCLGGREATVWTEGLCSGSCSIGQPNKELPVLGLRPQPSGVASCCLPCQQAQVGLWPPALPTSPSQASDSDQYYCLPRPRLVSAPGPTSRPILESIQPKPHRQGAHISWLKLFPTVALSSLALAASNCSLQLWSKT